MPLPSPKVIDEPDPLFSTRQNNNPKVFTKDGRPIVEFSIENRKVINAREKRQQKSVEKNPLNNSKPMAKPMKPMIKPMAKQHKVKI